MTAETFLDTIGMTWAGYPFTVRQLRDAFATLEDRDHWKNPVDREVTIQEDELTERLALIHAAIVFMTGSTPTVQPIARDASGAWAYRVRAAGYFAAVGS